MQFLTKKSIFLCVIKESKKSQNRNFIKIKTFPWLHIQYHALGVYNKYFCSHSSTKKNKFKVETFNIQWNRFEIGIFLSTGV